jgi:hypothetical protein
MRLLSQTFKIEDHVSQKKERPKPEKPKAIKTKEPFHPKRYPSFFNMKTGKGDRLITIPEGEEKTVQFATDVEDNYFDRSEDPGDLKVSVLQYQHNEQHGGTAPGPVDDPDKLIDIRKSSPNEGTIKIGFGATESLKVGDEVEIQATLAGPKDLESRFWIKVVAPQPKPKEVKKEEPKEELPGLPGYVLAYKDDPQTPNSTTWDKLAEASVAMDFEDVMHPLVNGDGNLEKIFINMDSRVLRNYFSKQSSLSVENKELAEKKYISSVYFHTIFLFSITKNRKYELKQGERGVDVGEYLKDVFSSYYGEFLLNFGSEQLMASLAD